MSLDPSDDRAALIILEQHGIHPTQGGILVIPPGEYPDIVWEAVDLLVWEWDYDFRKVRPARAPNVLQWAALALLLWACLIGASLL